VLVPQVHLQERVLVTLLETLELLLLRRSLVIGHKMLIREIGMMTPSGLQLLMVLVVQVVLYHKTLQYLIGIVSVLMEKQ
jgi:hypothetical protein